MIRVLHVISGLETGGTELFLERLIRSLDDGEFEHQVVSLVGRGPVGDRMACCGAQVQALHVRGRSGAALGLFKLGRIVHDAEPDLVQGWLYHGNLAASLARRLGRVRCPLMWSVRHSLDQWTEEKALLRGEIRFSGWLAKAPTRIIFNSNRAARQHERLGYPRAKTCVIPNGFDIARFAPNVARRAVARGQLAFGVDTVVLGMVARYHPLKDHASFLMAARIVADEDSNARFVLAGRHVNTENRILMKLIRKLQLENRMLLLGERDDMAALMNAFDIYVSASSSEAFPNAVGEAMSCGLPCVVTDAGDSAELVANTGIVVPPKSPARLAEAMLQLVKDGADRRRMLGAEARERIQRHYSDEKISQRYTNLYRSLVKTV